jgi:hypothetical protein
MQRFLFSLAICQLRVRVVPVQRQTSSPRMPVEAALKESSTILYREHLNSVELTFFSSQAMNELSLL